MIRYLLDTNVLSEPMRPVPDATLLLKLNEHRNETAIPSIAWHEIWFGAMRIPASSRRRAIEDYLGELAREGVTIIPYDEAAATVHAGERARLASLGRTPSFADGQIAAVAIANGLTLVTSNVRDFRAFEGLQVEDWRSAGS